MYLGLDGGSVESSGMMMTFHKMNEDVRRQCGIGKDDDDEEEDENDDDRDDNDDDDGDDEFYS